MRIDRLLMVLLPILILRGSVNEDRPLWLQSKIDRYCQAIDSTDTRNRVSKNINLESQRSIEGNAIDKISTIRNIDLNTPVLNSQI
jgi:hypothetical protein